MVDQPTASISEQGVDVSLYGERRRPHVARGSGSECMLSHPSWVLLLSSVCTSLKSVPVSLFYHKSPKA